MTDALKNFLTELEGLQKAALQSLERGNLNKADKDISINKVDKIYEAGLKTLDNQEEIKLLTEKYIDVMSTRISVLKELSPLDVIDVYDIIVDKALEYDVKLSAVIEYIKLLFDYKILDKAVDLINKLIASPCFAEQCNALERLDVYHLLGIIKDSQGEYEEAMNYLMMVMKDYTNLIEQDFQDKGFEDQLKLNAAIVYDNISKVYLHMEDYENAEKYTAEAINIKNAFAEKDNAYVETLVDSFINLIDCYIKQDTSIDITSNYKYIISILNRKNKDSKEYKYTYAKLNYKMFSYCASKGAVKDSAYQFITKAIDLLSELLLSDYNKYINDLIGCYNIYFNVVKVSYAPSYNPKRLSAFNEIITGYKKLLELALKNSKNAKYTEQICNCLTDVLNNTAMAYIECNKTEQAFDCFAESASVYQQILNLDHDKRNTKHYLNSLAQTCKNLVIICNNIMENNSEKFEVYNNKKEEYIDLYEKTVARLS